MESWIGAIPLRTQFIVFFDTFPAGLNSDIIRGLEPSDGAKRDFDIDFDRDFDNFFDRDFDKDFYGDFDIGPVFSRFSMCFS